MSISDLNRLRTWAHFVRMGHTLVERGPIPAARYSYQSLAAMYADWDFDRRHHVTTFERVPLAGLTVLDSTFDHENDKRRYQQTSVVVLNKIFTFLPIMHSEYVFVDFGSGKGKALLIASEYNFKRIVGVEFAEELHRVAERNLLTYSNPYQRCHDIELVLGDAADLAIPEEKCVLFMYNPFRGAEHVLSKIIGNIHASYRANPRSMYVVYVNPVSQHLFNQLEFLRLRETLDFHSDPTVIYEASSNE